MLLSYEKWDGSIDNVGEYSESNVVELDFCHGSALHEDD